MVQTPLKKYEKGTKKRADSQYRASQSSRMQDYASRRNYAMPTKAYKGTGYVDTSVSPIAGNTTGSIALLNTVPQGTSVNTRVGKKILLKGLQMRGTVNGDSNCITSQFALMIVWDRRPSGALPAITDILDTVSPVSFLNDSNSSRFHVLWRYDSVNIGASTSAQTDTQAQVFNEYVKIPKNYKQTSYRALGTGAIADIDEGALYFVAVGGNVAGTGDSIGSMAFRLRFYDQSG